MAHVVKEEKSALVWHRRPQWVSPVSYGGAGGLYVVGGVVFLVDFACCQWTGCSWWVLPVLPVNQTYFPSVALRLLLDRVVTPCFWCV